MSRRSPIRAAAAVAVLGTFAAVLGAPPRPILPVGAVSADVMTDFVVDALRLLITVAVWYLIVAVALDTVSRLPGAGALVRPVADRVVGAGVAAMLRRMMATSVVVGVALPGAAGAQAADPVDEPPVMVPVEPEHATLEGSAAVSREPAPADDAGTPTMTRRPATSPSRVAEAPAGAETDTAPPERSLDSGPDPTMRTEPRSAPGDDDVAAPRRSAPAEATHTVVADESFWSIAAAIVRDRTPGSEPAVAQVASTWQQLVDHNVDILVDPGNPDLLHVGQVIDVSGLA